jgi:hypothetical protein
MKPYLDSGKIDSSENFERTSKQLAQKVRNRELIVCEHILVVLQLLIALRFYQQQCSLLCLADCVSRGC